MTSNVHMTSNQFEVCIITPSEFTISADDYAYSEHHLEPHIGHQNITVQLQDLRGIHSHCPIPIHMKCAILVALLYILIDTHIRVGSGIGIGSVNVNTPCNGLATLNWLAPRFFPSPILIPINLAYIEICWSVHTELTDFWMGYQAICFRYRGVYTLSDSDSAFYYWCVDSIGMYSNTIGIENFMNEQCERCLSHSRFQHRNWQSQIPESELAVCTAATGGKIGQSDCSGYWHLRSYLQWFSFQRSYNLSSFLYIYFNIRSASIKNDTMVLDPAFFGNKTITTQ